MEANALTKKSPTEKSPAEKPLAGKPPMATPGFKALIPKAETEYDKKVQEEWERRMTDCCDGYSPYDYYGYKPRPQNPTQDSPATPESTPAPEPLPDSEPQHVPETDKKNSKR